MSTYASRRRKYFALSFISAFFVFWLVFLLLMSAGQTSSSPRAVGDSTSALIAYQPQEEDALTLLAFGTEHPGSVADTFLLLRFDPVRGQVVVVTFPPGTVLTHNDAAETLADAFRFGGAAYTRSALEQTLSVPIDRHARVTLSGFVAAAAAVGTVEFELYEPLSIHIEGQPITLNPGMHLLDGRQVAELIRYQGHSGGQAGRAKLTTRLVCAVIDQRIDVVHSTLLNQIFATVINLVDTDVTYADFERRVSGARAMAEQGEPVTLPIILQGRFCEDDVRFYLADTALAQIARAFL
ncbi:MAG: LCP family protein [Oscillospiraceae bacterium]|nr:LCP family protein [Oscillospiraceae bacterium]